MTESRLSVVAGCFAVALRPSLDRGNDPEVSSSVRFMGEEVPLEVVTVMDAGVCAADLSFVSGPCDPALPLAFLRFCLFLFLFFPMMPRRRC
jgi:hypothetical protein